MRAARHGCVQHAVEADIVDEDAAAGKEASILEPRYCTADEFAALRD